jgi:Reverse transcriptase (RNA-dependent DNA polymerase)
MDVKNTFLQGILEEKVNMTLLSGHQKKHVPNRVCRLKTLIYKLKQFSRTWYGKLNRFLISYNFKVRNVDSSLFIKHNFNSTIIVLIYVDDIIIINNNQIKIKLIKKIIK